MSSCLILNRCVLVNHSQVEFRDEKLLMQLAPDMSFDLTICEMHEFHKFRVYSNLNSAQFKQILQDYPDAMYENFELRNNCLIIESSVEVIESKVGSNLILDSEITEVEFKLTVFALLRFLITHDCNLVITRGFLNKIRGSINFEKVNNSVQAESTKVIDLSLSEELNERYEQDLKSTALESDTLEEQESESISLESILVSEVSEDEKFDDFKNMLQSLQKCGKVNVEDVGSVDLSVDVSKDESIVIDSTDSTVVYEVPFSRIRCSLVNDTVYVDIPVDSEIYRVPIWSVSNKLYQNYWSVRASTSTIQMLKNLYSTCVMSISGNLIELSPFGATPVGLTSDDFYVINSSALVACQLGYREMISTAYNAVEFAEFIAQQLAGVVTRGTILNQYPDKGRNRYLISGNSVDILYMKSLLFGKTRNYILSNILAALKGKINLMEAMQRCFTFKGIYGKIFLTVFCNTLKSAKVIYNQCYFDRVKQNVEYLLSLQDTYMLELRTLQLEYRGVLEPLRKGVRSGDLSIRVIE